MTTQHRLKSNVPHLSLHCLPVLPLRCLEIKVHLFGPYSFTSWITLLSSWSFVWNKTINKKWKDEWWQLFCSRINIQYSDKKHCSAPLLPTLLCQTLKIVMICHIHLLPQSAPVKTDKQSTNLFRPRPFNEIWVKYFQPSMLALNVWSVCEETGDVLPILKPFSFHNLP